MLIEKLLQSSLGLSKDKEKIMQAMEIDDELLMLVEEHVYSKLQLVDSALVELYARLRKLEEKDTEKDKRLFFLEIKE